VATLVQKINTEQFNQHFAEDFLSNLITQANDPKLEKVSNPLYVHVYRSLSGRIKSNPVAMNSYRLNFSIDEECLMAMDARDFYNFLRDDILDELKKKWWDNTTKIFLYAVLLQKSISPVSAWPTIRATLRFATLPENICLDSKAGVDMFLGQIGINKFLKKYEPILVENPSICDYIKKNYRDYKDKVRLWEVLHGYSQPGVV
jgi:hypothetical protein